MLNLEAIKQSLIQKTNEQLIDILSFTQDDYNPSVIPLIKNILIERGITQTEINNYDEKYNSIIQSNKLKPQVKKEPDFWDKAWKILLSAIVVIILTRLLFIWTHHTDINLNPINKADTPWSEQYENNIYRAAYLVADSIFSDEDSKKKMASCFVQKIKTQLPRGVEAISKDSLGKLYTQIGEDCAKEIKKFELKTWTPEYESKLKNALVLSPLLKELKQDVKIKFCDCYVNHLKEAYPDGIKDTIPADVQNKIAKKCVKQLRKK